MIHVTKPFLPPQKEYQNYLNKIWDTNWLTNNGPLVQELESRLQDYLNIENLLFVSNGTIALQIAIKALDLSGTIITTPFSYIATTSSIIWEHCKPVFVDIDPISLNINSSLIEEKITSDTTAILATHVFSNPCDVEHIEKIAEKYNLKVIYDGAHSFGVNVNERSIFSYGDISTASFHATKIFHTIEGGAMVFKDKEIYKKASYMRNFGHDGPSKFNGVGINGKNSEFHAAMGLCNLKYIDSLITERTNLSRLYDKYLKDKSISLPLRTKGGGYNYSYYPVIFNSEMSLLNVQNELNKNDIYPRRYFYPPLNKIKYVDNNDSTPISDSVSKQILCLPLYHDLTFEDIQRISAIILSAINP